MTLDLDELEWLSIGQALKRLQAVNKNFDMEDLQSYCVEGRMHAYIRLEGAAGVLEDEPDQVVYGVGYQV